MNSSSTEHDHTPVLSVAKRDRSLIMRWLRHWKAVVVAILSMAVLVVVCVATYQWCHFRLRMAASHDALAPMDWRAVLSDPVLFLTAVRFGGEIPFEGTVPDEVHQDWGMGYSVPAPWGRPAIAGFPIVATHERLIGAKGSGLSCRIRFPLEYEPVPVLATQPRFRGWLNVTIELCNDGNRAVILPPINYNGQVFPGGVADWTANHEDTWSDPNAVWIVPDWSFVRTPPGPIFGKGVRVIYPGECETLVLKPRATEESGSLIVILSLYGARHEFLIGENGATLPRRWEAIDHTHVRHRVWYADGTNEEIVVTD